ncbi:MAG: peptidase [Proteobacteria bacterium]|nr:peptidase [Pseudomonadota bacterium]
MSNHTLVQSFLASRGFAVQDLQTEIEQARTFSDGAHYRIEVPTINSVAALAALLEAAYKRNVIINRITETLGMFRHARQDITEYVSLCASAGALLTMSVGPRAVYDTGASAGSIQGKLVGYRLRGQDQINRAVKDIMRGLECGVQAFVVYDEGLLWLLNELRNAGILPRDTLLKASAHMGCCNPISAKVFEQLGADTINPIRDLHISMIRAIRQAVSVPLDIHTDNPLESGGFIRYFEAADIVRAAAPVYLKTGNSILQRHGSLPSVDEARAMAEQISIVVEMMRSDFPEARQSPTGKQELLATYAA